MPRRYQTVLVTGASSGMGKDFALRLLREGMTVYAAARSVDKMQDLEEAGAIVLKMDITRDEDIVAAADRIIEAHGGVDVLINNAGYGQYGPVEDTPVEKARYQFEVNIFGLARVTQLLLPAMRARRKGLIINISSVGGRIFTPLGAWYHATKHALEGWSDCLRLELAPFGVDVVIVEPGIIRTGFADGLVQNFAVAEDSAYAGLARRLRSASEAAYRTGRGSPSTVVTEVIVRAIDARRPRTRYAVGQFARTGIFLRWLLPDRVFERAVMSQIG